MLRQFLQSPEIKGTDFVVLWPTPIGDRRGMTFEQHDAKRRELESFFHKVCAHLSRAAIVLILGDPE